MQYTLKQVSNTYHFWGSHSILYKLACLITFLGREKKLRKLTIEKLKLKEGDTVLDIACGTGLNFKILQKYIGQEGKIIGIDYSKEMLLAAQKRVKENNWKNVALIHEDATKISLPSKVDGMLSTLGISAIPQYKKALKKAIKILKNGRTISILDAKLPQGIWKIFNPLIALIYGKFAEWNYNKNIPKDLKKLIGKISLEEYNGGTIYIVYATKR